VDKRQIIGLLCVGVIAAFAVVANLRPQLFVTQAVECDMHRTLADVRDLVEADKRGAVAECVNQSADLTAFNTYGFTPLTIEVANGDTVAVVALLNAGTNPNAADRSGDLPLFYVPDMAIPENRLIIVDALLAAGADPSRTSGGQNAVRIASGHPDAQGVVERLLAENSRQAPETLPDPKALMDTVGYQCLHEVGKHLLEAGARLDQMDDVSRSVTRIRVQTDCTDTPEQRAYRDALLATDE